MIVMLQTAEDTIVTFRLYIHKTSFLLSGNNKDHIESLKNHRKFGGFRLTSGQTSDEIFNSGGQMRR